MRPTLNANEGNNANEGKVTGDLQRLTKDSAPDYQASVSGDGKKLVFISTRSGNEDIWLKDLETGKERAITSAPLNKLNPRISTDGSRVAFNIPENNNLNIYVLPIRGGQMERVCENCGIVESWSSDGKKLLFRPAAYLVGPPAIGVFNLLTRERFDFVRMPKYTFWQSYFSPDDQWIVSLIFDESSSYSHLYIAPFLAGRPLRKNEWIPVPSASNGGEDIRAALITNFRHKLQCKEDLQTEAVVELFRRAWQKQQQVATFCDDEHPDRMGGLGEELVRIYMRRAAPSIQPAAIEQRTMRGYSRAFASRRSSISSTRMG